MTMPQSEWERIGDAAEAATTKAMDSVIRTTRALNSTERMIAVGLGTTVCIGRYFAALWGDHCPHVTEQMALAYLRGALRGADGPLNADGTPYMGAMDA